MTVLGKRKEKRYKNSYLVKNLFRESYFIDRIDKLFTNKKIMSDMEYIGLNITTKQYTIIKIYLSLILSASYMLLGFVVDGYISLITSLITALILVVVLLGTGLGVKACVAISKANIRYEFVNFLGTWSRNIELGSNLISSLEKSCNLVKGSLYIHADYLMKDIKASQPVHVAIKRFGVSCRDSKIIEFCNTMESDIRDGVDITQYIVDTNRRIQNDKATLIENNTEAWTIVLSGLVGTLIFFSFAIYLMLFTLNSL